MRPLIRPIVGKQRARSSSSDPTTTGPFARKPELNPTRPDPNRYSALACLPPINPLELPQSCSTGMLVLKKPFSKDPEPSTSSSPRGELRFSQKQTSDYYKMKQPQSFAEAVTPNSAKQAPKERKI